MSILVSPACFSFRAFEFRNLLTSSVLTTSKIQNIEATPSQATRNAEIRGIWPRENGYCGFCFQRLTACDREKDLSFYPRPDSEWIDEKLLLNSNNRPFKKLGFYQVGVIYEEENQLNLSLEYESSNFLNFLGKFSVRSSKCSLSRFEHHVSYEK